MARTSILRECCEIIRNNEEADCECYGVGYYLSFDEGKIQFHRVTTSPTGEYYSDGGIDTKSHSRAICEWDASLEDYCNLAVVVANGGENLKYEFGEDVECIAFKGIY